jgi:tetratricopeptide (TPR) repeat protein
VVAETASTRDWRQRAHVLYERAVFVGDAAVLPVAEQELDRVEADLLLARGRIRHARFLEDRQEDPEHLPLLERAAQLYATLGDDRGQAEASFWIGVYHQVLHRNTAAARPALERSYQLAVKVGDQLTASYAVRHLGFADQAAGDLEQARARLAESLRLRRELDHRPAVAAALVALADLTARTGHREQARAMLEEATATAEAAGAHRVVYWANQARDNL